MYDDSVDEIWFMIHLRSSSASCLILRSSSTMNWRSLLEVAALAPPGETYCWDEEDPEEKSACRRPSREFSDLSSTVLDALRALAEAEAAAADGVWALMLWLSRLPTVLLFGVPCGVCLAALLAPGGILSGNLSPTALSISRKY